MAADGVVVRALGLLAGGRAEEALAVLTAPVGEGGRLRGELAEYLQRRRDGRVYDEPAAFQAFVSGGGNVGLYRVVVARLAAVYRELGVRSVLDVGCGDGRAVVPAAVQLGADAPQVDLVEPSAALLADAQAAARLVGLPVRTHHGTVQSFLSGVARRWDLVESTFALHAIEPAERTDVLAELRGVADALLIVEFDVPDVDHASPEHLASLAQRYAQGLDEYPDSLVAQGFLMPVLVGQLEPDQVRHTWEQPAAAWAAQLATAGWTEVTVTRLADYWWAPAVMLTARASSAQHASAEQIAEHIAAERAAAVERIASLSRRFDDMVAASALSTGDDEHDPEGATIAYERAQISALLAQARTDLDDLDRAAARLADGSYGTCQRCGGTIADQRLQARPTATTCITCANASQRRR